MLSFIETQSFKKLDNFRADFTEGTNLILGPNGFGKTTLFNALRFALYGTQAIASSTKNIPTWGAKKCKVKIGMANDFLIVRTLSDCKIYKAASDGTLLESDELKVAEGNKPCTEWVKQHLGLDHKMFSVFNMSMQGETGALITLGATELNRIVENFSGVSILDTVIKSLSKESSHLEGALSTLVYADATATRNEAHRLAAEVKKASGAVESEKEILAELLTEQKKAQQDYQSAVAHNEKVADQEKSRLALQTKVDTLKPQVFELESTVADLGAQVEGSDVLGKLQKELSVLDDKMTAFDKDSVLHSSYESQLAQLNTEYDTAVKNSEKESEVATQRHSLESRLEQKESDLTSLTNNTREATSQRRSAKKTLEGGSCSECHRPFEDFNPEAAQLVFNDSVVELERCEELESACRKEVVSLKNKLKQLPNVGVGNEGKAKDLKVRAEDFEEKITTLEARWQDFDDEVTAEQRKSLQLKINEVSNKVSQYKRDSQRLSELRQQGYDAEQKLSEIRVEEKIDASKLGEHVSFYTEKLAQQQEDLAQCRKVLNSLSEQHTLVSAELKTLDKNNAKFEGFTLELDKVKRLMKFLRDSRTKYMDGVWSLILGAATGWIGKATQGWITEVGRNDKGEFTFTENGIVAPAYADASGAQKEFIGTSLRIGLGMALQGHNSMLLLDEPTAGMREENADKLATGLLGVSGQKIIITHRQSEKLTAANVINV